MLGSWLDFFSITASLILVASQIILLDARHMLIYLPSKGCSPTFCRLFGHWNSLLWSCWCVLSVGVQSAAATAVSLVDLSVSFHLFPFSCSSDVSFAVQDSVWPVPTRLTASALSTGFLLWWSRDGHELPLSIPVFSGGCLHRSWLLCSGNYTALGTARRQVFNNCGLCCLILS